VRNCRKVGKAFYAGVRIQDVFPAVAPAVAARGKG
jgi:hypothetical protein